MWMKGLRTSLGIYGTQTMSSLNGFQTESVRNPLRPPRSFVHAFKKLCFFFDLVDDLYRGSSQPSWTLQLSFIHWRNFPKFHPMNHAIDNPKLIIKNLAPSSKPLRSHQGSVVRSTSLLPQASLEGKRKNGSETLALRSAEKAGSSLMDLQ